MQKRGDWVVWLLIVLVALNLIVSVLIYNSALITGPLLAINPGANSDSGGYKFTPGEGCRTNSECRTGSTNSKPRCNPSNAILETRNCVAGQCVWKPVFPPGSPFPIECDEGTCAPNSGGNPDVPGPIKKACNGQTVCQCPNDQWVEPNSQGLCNTGAGCVQRSVPPNNNDYNGNGIGDQVEYACNLAKSATDQCPQCGFNRCSSVNNDCWEIPGDPGPNGESCKTVVSKRTCSSSGC